MRHIELKGSQGEPCRQNWDGGLAWLRAEQPEEDFNV